MDSNIYLLVPADSNVYLFIPAKDNLGSRSKTSTHIKQHCNPKSPYSHLFSFIAATAITSPLSLPPSHSIAADTFTTPLFTTDRDADKPHILHQRLYSGDLKQKGHTQEEPPYFCVHSFLHTKKIKV